MTFEEWYKIVYDKTVVLDRKELARLAWEAATSNTVASSFNPVVEKYLYLESIGE